MQLNLLADVIMGSSPTGDTLNLEAGLEFHQGKVFFGDIYLNRSPIKTTNPVKTAEAGDIVICVRAPVGEVNIVDRKICIGRGLASLKAKRNVPTRFLFHLLRLQKKNFDLIASGSTFASITVEQLKNIAFITPPYEQQLRIADILGSLDEKIEINRRKIKELEALAKLIYDYWFVQFDFPDENGRPFKSSGGKMVWNDTLKREIPDGWEVGDLGTMISRVGTGLNPRNNFVFGGKVRYLTVKNLTESGTIDFTDCDTINEQAKLLVHSRSDITIGDILFASIEPLGRCYLISETPVNWDINESVFTIRPAYGLTSSEYLYHFFRSTRFIREASQQSTGSIFKGIRMSALLCMKVLIPPMSVINTYSYSAKKIILRQSNANTENDNLKEYRDWLLPMLMNGQVEVTE